MDLPVPESPTTCLRIGESDARTRVNGIRVHGSTVAAEVELIAGRPVTAPVPTFLDLAAHLSLVDLVVFGDAIVRRRGVAPTALRDATDRATGRGVRVARRAARLVRARVDSPMETRLRLLLVLAGLPEPVVGQPVYDRAGGWLATPDLQYPDARVAIEYDGGHHRESRRQWRRDIRRKENFDFEGWRALTVIGGDIDAAPGATIARVHSALLARRCPGLPRRLSDEWRAHFVPRHSSR